MCESSFASKKRCQFERLTASFKVDVKRLFTNINISNIESSKIVVHSVFFGSPSSTFRASAFNLVQKFCSLICTAVLLSTSRMHLRAMNIIFISFIISQKQPISQELFLPNSISKLRARKI